MSIPYLDRWDGSAWQSIDIDAAGICDIVLKTSMTNPHTLTFSAQVPQHIISGSTIGNVADHVLIRLRADDYASGVDPLFEGIVHIEPGSDSIGVKFTAIDPTGYTNFPLMSYGWELSGGLPVPVTGGRPFFAVNCWVDNDQDWIWQADYGLTVGKIIKLMLDYQTVALRSEYSCNYGDVPYVIGDLNALTTIPQEKFVCESEGVRSAIQRLLRQYYPTHRLVWEPGTRYWRIVNLKSATEVDLTLNDPTATDVVLSFQLHRSVEDRYTAVEIYGPPVAIQWDEYHAHPTISTTLASSASAGATTLSVTSATGFTDPGFAICDGEVIEITGISGTTLTVVATQYAHASGATIYPGAECTLLNGGLTDISTGPVLESWGAGVLVYGKNRYQVTDTNKRRILPLMKDPYTAPNVDAISGSPSTGYTIHSTGYETTYQPCFLARWPHNNMGDGRWQTVRGASFDYRDGVIYWPDGVYANRYNPNPPLVGGLTGPHSEVPDDVKLIYCTPGNPLMVRYPSSGYSGTAYSVANISKTKRINDELLSLEYMRNPSLSGQMTTITASTSIGATSFAVTSSIGFPATPFTALIGSETLTVTGISGLTWTTSAATATHTAGDAISWGLDRVAQYTALATNLHAQLCDIIFAGGCNISGMKWDYLFLSKRINIEAVDADGATLTTGWESAGAWLTETEYNFTDQTTTLVMSSDQLQIMGQDVDALKKALKIKPLVPTYRTTSFVEFTPRSLPDAARAHGLTDQQQALLGRDFASGTRTTFVGYFDPQTGERQG